MANKPLITYSTGSSSPVYTGVCVGVEDNREYPTSGRPNGYINSYKFEPDYGDRTYWDNSNNWPFEYYSRSGTDPSYSRTSSSRIIVRAEEGKDRDRIMTWGSTSGKYPLARTLDGITFDYKVSRTDVHCLHLRSYGVEWVLDGTTVKTWSSAPQSRGSTTAWQTITMNRSRNPDLFNPMPNDDYTYIRRILILLSTRGGTLTRYSEIEFANFRYLYKPGSLSSAKIVLPPNRPYADRNKHLKLTK